MPFSSPPLFFLPSLSFSRSCSLSLLTCRLPRLHQDIVAFRDSLTIGDALDVFGHYELFSAPVVSAATGAVVGEVDYLDLLSELVRLTVEADGGRAVSPYTLALLPDELEHLTRRANDWSLSSLLSYGALTSQCLPSASVGEVIAMMGAGHRHVLIVDGGEEGSVSNLVSQTDMMAYVASHLGEAAQVAGLTLGELGLGVRQVHCVRNTDSALDAFLELAAGPYDGGAIVNEQGKLVGNLSRHDLKGVQGQDTDFGLLNQSIMHYQRKHRVALAQRLVTVTQSSTLGEIVTTMAKEKVQRVFLVEHGMVPRGLVTQTDVCRVLAERLATNGALGKKRVTQLRAQHAATTLDFPLVFPPH